MSSLHRPESFLSITILFFVLAVGGAFATGGQDDGATVSDRPDIVDREPPRKPRRGRGPMSTEDYERLIAVADDISPEWASSLRARLGEDPENARADMRRYGRRLFGLAMLKDTNPELYKVRIAELALKKGIRDQASRYHAILATDPGQAEVIASSLKEMVAESVDLELRARALELKALDQAVRELRDRLMSEVTDSKQKAERIWQELLAEPLGDDEEMGPLDGLRLGPGGSSDRDGSRRMPASGADGGDRG